MYRLIIVRPNVPVPQIAGHFRDPVAAQVALDRRRQQNQRVYGEVQERRADGRWERLCPVWEMGCLA